jgi:hypothetical protein
MANVLKEQGIQKEIVFIYLPIPELAILLWPALEHSLGCFLQDFPLRQ